MTAMTDQTTTDNEPSPLDHLLEHNLTQHMQLEEVLWKTARRFQTLIENSSDIVVILTADGSFRYVSRSAKKILGYDPADLVGTSFYELTHPDDAATISESFQEALQYPGTGLTEVEYRIRHHDGTWHTFAASVTNLLDDSAVKGLLVNCHDITDRKQAEEALRQSKDRLRRFISSISDHIYVTEVSADGHCINRYISPNVEDLTGYPRQKFLEDRSFWPSTVIYPADRAAAAIQAAQLEMGRKSEMEYRLVRADGEIVWVRDSGTVHEENGSRIIYGVVSNITERKRLEEQFRQSQKMEAIGRLAGGIAHDFNNLLTVIIGNCDFIVEDQGLSDQLRQDVERIKKTGERAANLTSQLLAFSRKQVLQPEILELNSVVSNMDKMLRRLIGEDIELSTTLAPDLGRIKADPGQMEQVVMNLVVNARDAMPGGGKLTIETASVDLDESYVRRQVGLKPGPYVMLAVSDSGEGMSAGTQARIFEPFFTTKEQGQGTGLGLATVHGIISQSGGHIWVYSEPEMGTTFKIYLPRFDVGTGSVRNDQASEEPRHGSETVLLVEDEDTLRELASRVLLNEGYTVLEARHGAAAYQISERYQGPIDLLVTDVVMPGGISGLQLSDSLTMARPELKVLFMSGYTDQAITHHGILDPSTAYLEKPFTLNILTRKVREVLDEP
jgi:PAS domain S-box-containing protein